MRVKTSLSLLMRDIAWSLIILISGTALMFAIIKAVPGDPFQNYPDQLKQSLCLDRPPIIQYICWVGRLLQGDFGFSAETGQPVTLLIMPRVLRTVYLTFGSLIISLVIGVTVGVLAAVKTESSWMTGLTSLVYIVSSIPIFILGYIVVFYIQSTTGWIPHASNLDQTTLTQRILFYVSPIVVLGCGNGTLIEIVTHVRDNVRTILSERHIQAVVARGASVWAHVAKHSLIPIAAVVNTKFAYLIGGAVVVEYIFNWDGLGHLSWKATIGRDYFVLLGLVFLAALAVRILDLLNRWLVIWVDPRVGGRG